MPWHCSMCGAFAADSVNLLLNHIGRCHRNDPNFHCVCGIDGCANTFKKYYTWRKHIKKKHANITNDNPAVHVHQQPVANMDIDPDMIGNDVEHDQVKRASALYLLKLQEECCLPKSTVQSVVANTKSVVQETLSIVKTQVQVQQSSI